MQVDPKAEAYIAGIDPDFRPLFDRIRALVETNFPDADLGYSYRMPTFTRAGGRLHLGVWQHGVSLYGWDRARCPAFLDRHPSLRTSSGTVRVRPSDADDLSDDELGELVRAALEREPD
jgi:uncharacterized protein YdhG (YjbR/CyaY superfamily)